MNDHERVLAVFHKIKGHYFDDECKHETHEKCCEYLIEHIAKIVGYESYKTIVTDGRSKENES